MIKIWIKKALGFLEHSLKPIPQEMNELDWKQSLSPNNDKLIKHLSAFANLPGGGYMVFGIENRTGNLTGIKKEEADAIVEKLSNLCRDSVLPVIKIDHTIELYQNVSLLFVFTHESASKPVHLKSGTIEDSYIRSGGTTRRASRQEVGGLMLNSKTPQYEELHCSSLKSSYQIMDLLDFRSIFKLLNKPIPQSDDEILQWMKDEKMIEPINNSGYYITNFGALAAAHNLHDFDNLSRKSIRLIRYEGVNKLKTEKEYPGSKGYAIGFKGLISFIKALLPGSEIIKNALRKETTIYPEIALREIIANALIHQDFTTRGFGPMIEIFDDRIEVSNPGKLLPTKQIDRLIGTTPESRNEVLAAAFRRYNICEERGSGFQKAVAAIELFGLPPLKFIETENSFKVIMYSPRKFADMMHDERVEAAYQHSIIKYYSSGGMTNTSLRERFKLGEKQSSQVSRLIKEALTVGKIKLKDPGSAKKFSLYIPYWG
jgi:ATP-dependent DNA helicase RecG